MNAIWHELRVAVRSLAAQPRFTAISVVLLALGIGVSTAVFSVVNAVLLRPLPYHDPSRLVAVTGVFVSPSRPSTSSAIPLTEMAKWRPQSRALESMGGFAYTQLPIRIGDRSLSPVTALMDPEFLPTLGPPLALGTFFDAGAAPGSDRSAIVSHALWRDGFGSDPNIVGRTVSIDGEPYEIRGVLAADFQFPRSDASYFARPVDLLMPSSVYPGFPAAARQWFGIARLKPDVSIAQAEAELRSTVMGLLPEAAGGEYWSAALTPLAEETTRRSRPALLVVLGISILLLLIASTNLMNLFFARGIGRLREMSIRRAIGSTTWQLLRLLLIESIVLALAGGVLGTLFAALAIRVLVAMSPVHLPVTHAIDIDATVLGFAMLLCVGTAIAAGLLPALHVSARTLDAVRSSGMRTSPGRGISRIQRSLCVAQIALGMALLAGAGLLANSLWRMYTTPRGYDVDRVLGFNLSVPNDLYGEARVRFYQAALDEVRTIPGVEQAGFISFLPPETRAGVFMGLEIEGVPPPERGAPARVVNTLITSAGYFTTMKMAMVRGRGLTEADTAAGRPVIVVNEALVRRYFPDVDPIGRKIGTGFDRMTPMREIVGVVADSHDRGVALKPYPTVYIPFTQFTLPYAAMAVRIASAAEAVVPVIRDRVSRLNPSVPLTDFGWLDDRVHASLREPRFYMVMAAVSAGMAVLFVTFGLYGLVSYSVGRRTAELGIRMAIGAQRGTIVRMVLRQGLGMAAAGIVLGLGGAILGARALESLLFGVRPNDPPTFAAAAVVVVAVTLVACLAPARRASRVNPIAALRAE